MKSLAALTLVVSLWACGGSAPLGIKVGDRVQSVTLKDGQIFPVNGATVQAIDGTRVTLSVGEVGFEMTCDFADVAAWEPVRPQ